MSTFAARLTGGRKRLMLWATIQGVERVFKEGPAAVSLLVLGETRAESACIPTGGIDQGEARIDYEQLAQVGGGLKLRLHQARGTTFLEDIFQTQRRRATFLMTTEISKTAVTWTVGDTAGFGAVDSLATIHMGAETIRARVASATTFTDAVRAKYGSRAQVHEGGGTNGTALFTVPPALLGRRVTLYGSFLKGDGTTTAALTRLLGTFTIDKNPAWVDDRTVEIECGPAIDELMNRHCYVGVKESTAGVFYLASDTAVSHTLEVADGLQFEESASGYVSYVLVQTSRWKRIIGRLVSNDLLTVPNTLTMRIVPGLMRKSYFAPGDDLSGVIGAGVSVAGARAGVNCASAKHFAILHGTLSAPLLQVLTSFGGDKDNGTRDVLPGRERGEFNKDDWRMGAGIDQADIDVNAFQSFTTQNWAYILDATTPVRDLLKDWCLLADRFVFGTAAGLLSTRSLSETRGTAALSIGASTRAPNTPVRTYVDESSIFPLLIVKANYSILDGEFKYTETHVDHEMVKRYSQHDEARTIELKGLGVDVQAPPTSPLSQHFIHPNPISQDGVRQIGRRIQQAYGRGRLICEVPCSLRALACELGDIVDIAFDAPDYQGGSIRGRVGRVVGRRPQYDEGRCDLTLHVLEDSFVFAPSPIVTGVSTGTITNDTVTLSTVHEVNDDSSPSDNFAVGMTVRLWSVSAGTSQELVVAAIPSASSLRFTAGVVGAVEANRDWLTWSTLGSNVGITSASGYAESDLAYLMADSGVPITGAVRRWR